MLRRAYLVRTQQRSLSHQTSRDLLLNWYENPTINSILMCIRCYFEGVLFLIIHRIKLRDCESYKLVLKLSNNLLSGEYDHLILARKHYTASLTMLAPTVNLRALYGLIYTCKAIIDDKSPEANAKRE